MKLRKVSFPCFRTILTYVRPIDTFPFQEMAESMSAYSAVRDHLYGMDQSGNSLKERVSYNDRNIILIAVGDGCTPRTAALFAFRTQWTCISVDPAMRSGPWHAVSNLTTIQARIQDTSITVSDEQRAIVIMWHAHVSIREALSCLVIEGAKFDVSSVRDSAALRTKVALVSCACCNYDERQKEMPDGSEPDVEFEDIAVPSLMRAVRVWKFLPSGDRTSVLED